MRRALAGRAAAALAAALLLAAGCDFEGISELKAEMREPEAAAVLVTGLSMNKSSTVILVGGNEQLGAVVSPANATNKAVAWSSDDEGVAAVSATGLVAGLAPGTATISATAADGGYVATCGVTVSAVSVAVTGLELDAASAQLVAGATRQLVATIAPPNATNQNVNWSSTDPAVASVSPTGLVTSLTLGYATIIASSADGGFTKTCTIAVPGIRLSAASVEVGRNATVQLAATVVPSGSTVSWTSSAPAAATVSAAGLVTGEEWGRSTTITATSAEGYSATELVKVMGVVSTLAGQKSAGSVDGPAAAASFNSLRQMAYTGGFLYVADLFNNKIRRVDSISGAVMTFAGSGAAGRADGTGTAATFNGPFGIATDSIFLYITDDNLIRKIQISNALVTTIAGNGDAGLINATGLSASFNCPKGIIANGSNLYVADSNNHLIRQIEAANSKVTTFAGSGTNGIVDGIGAAARFELPWGITSYGTDLYVLDWDFTNGAAIRRIAIGSVSVSSLAGSATERGYADGTGAAVRLKNPNYGASDGTYLYFTDNYMVRRLTIATGEVVTLAGLEPSTSTSNDDGTGTAARFLYPSGIALVGTKLYVNDQYRIRIVQ